MTDQGRPLYTKKVSEPTVPARLPVVWTHCDGRRELIRGMATPLMIAIVKKFYIVDASIIALCRELRTRHIAEKTRAMLQRIDPEPCACGRPGLYVVNTTTYCAACKHLALHRKTVNSNRTDARKTDAERFFKDIQQEQLSAERHHKARGRKQHQKP